MSRIILTLRQERRDACFPWEIIIEVFFVCLRVPTIYLLLLVIQNERASEKRRGVEGGGLCKVAVLLFAAGHIGNSEYFCYWRKLAVQCEKEVPYA